jgi:hypothetical protein
MAEYGYKISCFTVSGANQNAQVFPLDYPGLPAGSAIDLFAEVLRKLFSAGGLTGKKGEYISLQSMEVRRHCLLLFIRGGRTGDEFEIVRTSTDESSGRVHPDDALTWTSRLLIIFPPDQYDGMIVSETNGNSHHAVTLNGFLETALKRDHQLRFSVTHDVADGVAWKKILSGPDAYVQALEFRQGNPAHDGTGFAEDTDVTRVSVEYQLAKGSGMQKRVTDALTGRKPDRDDSLIRLVGGRRYSDCEFDDEIATVVSKGKPRKYRIAHRNQWFNYHIDSPLQLEPEDFIREVAGDVLNTYSVMSVDLPAGWSDS